MLRVKTYATFTGERERADITCESMSVAIGGMMCIDIRKIDGAVDIIDFYHTQSTTSVIINPDSIMEITST